MTKHSCSKCGSEFILPFSKPETTYSGFRYIFEYRSCMDCGENFVAVDHIKLNDERMRNARSTQCPTIYIDMDDVLCDFMKKFDEVKFATGIIYPQSQYGFFESLEPIEGAIEAMNKFQKQVEDGKFNVYILTAPSICNPLCYTEKRIWVEKNLGEFWLERLIISPNKGLLKGDVLIDDRVSGHYQDEFEGQVLQFGSKKFRNWEILRKHFR